MFIDIHLLYMFQHEYKQLCRLLNERSMEPFEFVVPDESDEESKKASEKDSESDDENDGEDEAFYDAVSFDDLFPQHQQWMKRFESLQPCYKTCVELAREGKEKHAELQQHLKDGCVKRATTSKTWSLFDEISENNDNDMYDKKKKQLEQRIKDINDIIVRFNDELGDRTDKLADWEERVAKKWKQVSSLFGLYGIPMTKNSIATLQWLYKKELVGSGYLGLFDIGHYLCSALLPYRKSLICGGVLAQFLATMHVDWTTTTRAFLSSELLNFLYPKLRPMRTSDFAIRTDTIIALLVMYNCDVDWMTNIGLCSLVQLWMMLCTNDMVIHYPYGRDRGDDDASDDDDDETISKKESNTAHTISTDSDQDCVVQASEYSEDEDETEKTGDGNDRQVVDDDKEDTGKVKSE